MSKRTTKANLAGNWGGQDLGILDLLWDSGRFDGRAAYLGMELIDELGHSCYTHVTFITRILLYPRR